ncbi:hypothetical protein [Niveispirillum sp.]|uniref:hypothetical protein n=1 Tax=Niveispirillum sp. TaxID=1917217 RepID=UPI001B638AEB|nr:hypothetical protein [Niveispirillum sp.]MBP7336909.1 hypothetical protein [Niveispirillum sp.]
MTATTIWIDADRAVDILSPDPAIIDIRFIAATLARINRYNGRTPIPYSVAQHSVLVASLLPARLRRHGLLHDAHEAILGDTTAPLKAALRHLTGIDALARLEAAWDQAIHAALGLSWPLPGPDAALIKAADMRALATEMRDLMDIPPRRLPHDPDTTIIRPMTWVRAEARYLDHWQRLTDAAAFATAAE